MPGRSFWYGIQRTMQAAMQRAASTSTASRQLRYREHPVHLASLKKWFFYDKLAQTHKVYFSFFIVIRLLITAAFTHSNYPNLGKCGNGCEEIESPDSKDEGGFCFLLGVVRCRQLTCPAVFQRELRYLMVQLSVFSKKGSL